MTGLHSLLVGSVSQNNRYQEDRCFWPCQQRFLFIFLYQINQVFYEAS